MILDYKLIGCRVRSMRKIRKLSQAELAERTGLSVPYISHIENGIKQASLLAIVNIAEALACSVDQLLYERRAGSRNVQQSEMTEFLSDCTAAEQRFLWEMLGAMKHCVKGNKQVFSDRGD